MLEPAAQDHDGTGTLAGEAPGWAVATAIYLGAALFQLYPAWTDPTHGVVGDWSHPDLISNHWLYRWVAETLREGGSLLHNDRYYVPVGDAPFLAGNGSDAVLAAPLAWLLAWPASVTAWCLVMVVANGLGARALARAAGASRAGATLAGLALVFSPYVVRELSAGRFAQGALWACGFFLATWLRLLARPTLVGGVLAGGLFGVCAFTYWYDGLWMAVAGALLWAFRPGWRPLVGFVPAALATTLPPLLLFLGHWAEIPGTGEDTFPHPLTVDYALPFSFPVWSGSGPLASLCLPLWMSGLAVAGWSAASRPLRRGVLVAAGFFYLMSLGPELLAPDGVSTGVTGPYALVYGLTGTLRRFWWPYRHLAPLTLVLIPLVGLGADRAVHWLRVSGAPWLLGLGLPLELAGRGAAIEVESSWFSPPAAYAALAGLPEGNLLELPIAASLTRSQASLSYQWVHGRPLVNGHAMWVDRVRPDAWDAWLRGQPLLAAWLAFEEGELEAAWEAPATGAPVDLGTVRYVTLNREFFPGELRALLAHHAAMLTAWYGEPVVKGGGVRVWDLTRGTGERRWVPPDWSPPEGYVSDTGLTALPGTVRSAGWRHWSRAFPPAEPAAEAAQAEPEATTRRDGFPAMLRRKLEREQADAAAAADTGTVEPEEATP